MTMPSKDALTPSEIVLIHGTSFAARKRPVKLTIVLLLATALSAYFVEAIVSTIREGWREPVLADRSRNHRVFGSSSRRRTWTRDE